MAALSNVHPMFVLIFAAAGIIILLTLFSRVLKLTLKLAVIGVMLLCIVYFLREAGLLPF